MARSYQLSAFNAQVPYRELYKIIVSATYTVVPEDNNKILIFSLGANATVNLPAAATVEGMNFKIWNGNSGAFTVTIDPQGAEQIDGAATLVLDPGEGSQCYAFNNGIPTSTGARWITDRTNATDIFSTAVVAGSTKNSTVRYTGTTATAGAFDGGATTPSATNRLNFGGYIYPSALNLVGTADTATAASHYFVETATDGFIRPKTLASTQAEIVTAATVNAIAVIAGTATVSVLRYNSTTATAGAFDGGAVDPTGTTRLNYSGNFYANNFFGTTVNNIYFNRATVTTAATTQTALLTVPHAAYITGKIFIRATRGTERQATELLITHDGTTAISTEYGTIATGNTLFTTDVDINSTNLRVLVTATSATSTVFVAAYTFI